MTMNEKALKLHEEWNGKLTTEAKSAVRTREDLALAYTPGVAEPCKVIAKDPEAAYTYTIKPTPWPWSPTQRRLRPWKHRPPGRHAGDGGKGRAL